MNMVFNYQTPVDNYEDFIGRRALVSKIYSRIGAGRPQSVSIVGDIKVGKSSLLWFLAQEKTKLAFLKNPDEYIYITMPCKTDDKLDLHNFTRRLFHLTKVYSDVEEEPRDIKLRYNYFKRMVEQIHKQGKKIILFLDDFNLVTQNSAFPLEFFSFMRSLANNYNLAYVTTSYEDLQKLCVSKDIEESPFFNIFTNMSLRGFNEEESKSYFTGDKEDRTHLPAGVYEYLLDLAGPSPYPLLMAGQYWAQFTDRENPLSPEQSKLLESKLQQNLQDYHAALWQYMEFSQKEIIENVAVNKEVPAAQEYLLRDLEKKDYIKYIDSKPKISSSLLRNYIIKNSGISVNENYKSQGSFLRLSQFFRHLFFQRGRL